MLSTPLLLLPTPHPWEGAPPALWCWDVSAERALRTCGPIPGGVVWRSAYSRLLLGAFKNTSRPEHTLTEDGGLRYVAIERGVRLRSRELEGSA